MNPIWQIDGKDVMRMQGDSAGFVRLLNGLLSASAKIGGLPTNALNLTVKDSEPDGGIDAVLDSAAVGDPTGLLSVPTCWQFKAQPTRNIKSKEKGGQKVALQNEISKPYAKKLIAGGYGYRLAIADALSPEKKAEWEGWLNEEVRKFDPNAPLAQVVGASALADWVNRYPALVSGTFRSNLRPMDLLGTWHGMLSALTPAYVPASDWTLTSDTIRRHVDFGNRVTTILTVQGEAGVGKSRGTCEALLGDDFREALIAVTKDERVAFDFAKYISSTPGTRAILVADECTLQFREKIGELLPVCGDRFRVIAIDNDLRGAGGILEVRFVHLRPEVIEAILNLNFPGVIVERRRFYSELSGGFVRLAVDLCQHDNLLPPTNVLEPITRLLQDRYLRNRLDDEELDTLAVISLLQRVGYKQDVRHELEGLCSLPLVGLRPDSVIKAADRMKQSPGFIAFAGRYLYVTPDLIARVAFQLAYDRWIAPDPATFLAAIPETLIESFIQRIERVGSPSMRTSVAGFFLDWATKLGPRDLGSEAIVARLVRLVEVQHTVFLPILRGLIDSSSTEELRSLHSVDPESQRARRQLAWLAEKLAHLPETFGDAEEMLHRLALAETEPHLGNSATRVWSALFRITRSGSPISFDRRLATLKSRFQDASPGGLALALAAFDESLKEGPVAQLATPPIIFGRTSPPQWRPSDPDSHQKCVGEVLNVAARITSAELSGSNEIREIVVRRLAPLLLNGHFDAIRAVVGPAPLPDSTLVKLSREIEELLDTFCQDHEVPIHRPLEPTFEPIEPSTETGPQIRRFPRQASSELETQVRQWYQGLVPGDVHGRVVGLVGQEFWHQKLHGDSSSWESSIELLAEELLDSPVDLDRELVWLSTPDARSAFRFGQVLAEADKHGALLRKMLWDAPQLGGTTISRGYLERIVIVRPELLTHINQLLDQLQAALPKAAYEIIWSSGNEVQKIERLFAMIDSEKLPAEYLRGMAYGLREHPLSPDQLIGAIDRLMRGVHTGKEPSASAAVYLLSSWLHPIREGRATKPILMDECVRLSLSRVLGSVLPGAGRADQWIALAKDWMELEPEKAVHAIAGALKTEDRNVRVLIEGCLIEVAATSPELVMSAIGAAATDPSSGWIFRVDDFSHLLDSVPVDVVQAWIERFGPEGARAFARHLPTPKLSENGNTEVHPLTEFVLSRFEEDEEVFEEFLGGTHLGEVYSDDIASEYDRQAEVARRFLSHKIKRVRDWARAELQSSSIQADYWRRRDEEDTVT